MKKRNISIINIPDELKHLENETMHTSSEIFSFLKNKSKQSYNPNCFLYHGLRFDENMTKLESIFKEQKILSGKKIENYFNYPDNVNKGEYVSLLEYSNQRVEYNVFISPNISLLVDPLLDAYQTIYLTYNDWDKIKDLKTKNLYSYMRGEYLYKDHIDFKYVKAIGVPYKYYLMDYGKEYADSKLEEVIDLMKKYNIDLPILDTSAYNKILKEKEMREENGKRNIR